MLDLAGDSCFYLQFTALCFFWLFFTTISSHSLLITCTAMLKCLDFARGVLTSFAWFFQPTAIVSLYGIHRLVFIMEQTVFSVRYEQHVSVKGKKEVKFSLSTEV